MIGHGWPWLAMVEHGWPWLAMLNHGWSWLSMVEHGLIMVGHGWPRLIMVGHGWAWLAMAGHGLPWLPIIGHGWLWFTQPRPQALSPLPLFVAWEKTLVAVGHVTTQNLDGEKSVGREGWQSVLIVAVTNFVGFKALSIRTWAMAESNHVFWAGRNLFLCKPGNVIWVCSETNAY